MFFIATLLSAFAATPTGGPVAWKATYAAADPQSAIDFCIRYLGARQIPQPHHGGNGTCSLIKWVTFDASGINYQFHFVDSFEARMGNFTLTDWAAYMEALNGNISSGLYNAYMDNHVGLHVTDMRPYLERLRRDNVPYFTRTQDKHDPGCDVFVQLPGNGIIVELACGTKGCCPDDVHPIGWDLCKPGEMMELHRRTARALEEEDASSGSATITLRPWKMTFASSDPQAAADFVVRTLGASHIPHPPSLSDVCGKVRWVEFPPPKGQYTGYQLHFVHNPRKASGKMSVEAFERYRTALHGDLRASNGTRGNAMYDAFMDNHVGLLVDDIAPYVKRLEALGVPFFTRGPDPQDVFVMIPGGIIFELAHKGKARTPLYLTPWDLCQH